MGRAIDGGEKSKFERSDTIGRRSFASTGSCCRPTDLAVVPPADGQLQGIAAEMNEIPWESKGEWRLRRVWCPICVHRLTRSTRKRACAGDVHFSMRRACRKKCDADPSLTEGGRTRGSQSPLSSVLTPFSVFLVAQGLFPFRHNMCKRPYRSNCTDTHSEHTHPRTHMHGHATETDVRGVCSDARWRGRVRVLS
jgi:hypothetical protein